MFIEQEEDKEIKTVTPITESKEEALVTKSETATKSEEVKPIINTTKEVINDKPVKRPFALSGNTNRPQQSFKSANDNRGANRPFQKRGEKPQSEFTEKLVDIARVTTVVKGGRRFSFSATVVIGNKKGKVGIGHGKANEVPDAIKKAVKDAQRNIVSVPVVNGTVPRTNQAKFVASKVLVNPAPKGKGLIASGSVRTVVELAGYVDIVTKSLGSSNKVNTVKATLLAISQLKTAEEVAALRDIDVRKITEK